MNTLKISSILFREDVLCPAKKPYLGEIFKDLRIEHVLDRLSAFHAEPAVLEVFRTPLTDPDTIVFRQQIMTDCMDARLNEAAGSFANTIRTIAAELDELQKRGALTEDLLDCGHYLHLAQTYCSAVCSLADADQTAVRSKGLQRFFQELQDYRASEPFCRMQQRIAEQYTQLNKIHFCMLLKDGKVRLRPYADEERLDSQLKALFSRFRQSAVESEPAEQPRLRSAHHIDAEILNQLAHWYPQEIHDLQEFPAAFPAFLEPGLKAFSKDIWFYLDWLKLIAPLQQSGLPFCCPEIAACGADLCCQDGFDLALALDLHADGKQTVTNSFSLEGEERILIVTGPNQGGKTTFARFFGQIFYWASLGCIVPGRRAVLRCFDGLFTHFNREENLDSLNGKLQNELERLHAITETATEQSIVVINEIFASTTLQDALFLGQHMLQELNRLGCAAICVTFLDELAAENNHTVSMMSTVNPDGSRSFRVIRKPADGLAYAMQLARKYQLDYKSLTRRLNLWTDGC